MTSFILLSVVWMLYLGVREQYIVPSPRNYAELNSLKNADFCVSTKNTTYEVHEHRTIAKGVPI